MTRLGRLPAILAVLLLHALGLTLLWGGSWPAGPASREPLSLRLIASPVASPPAALPPPSQAAAPAPALPSLASLALTPLPVALPSAPLPASPLPTQPEAASTESATAAAGPAPSLEPAPLAIAPAVAQRSAEPLRPARRAACPPAPHPPLLRERGIEGLVRLRVWVDELGRAGEVLVAASSGFRLFDEAAVAQARRCPYEAARHGGREIASWVEFPVRFALLQSGDSDAPP